MNFAEALSSYLPALVVRHFANRHVSANEAELRRFPAAVLFDRGKKNRPLSH